MPRFLIVDDDADRHAAFAARLSNATLVHAYTVASAKMALDELGPFDCAFLDHDLGDYGPRGMYGERVEYTGQDVAKHIASMSADRPASVVLHTWNPEGGKRMAMILAEVGLYAALSPFEFGDMRDDDKP